ESLRLLRLPRVAPVAPVNPVDVAWKAVVDAAGGLLWYVRRRDVPFRQQIFIAPLDIPITPIPPLPVALVGPTTPAVGAPQDAPRVSERDSEERIKELFSPLGLHVASLQEKSTAAAMVTVLRLLSANVFQSEPRDAATVGSVVAHA